MSNVSALHKIVKHPDQKVLWRLEWATETLPAKWVMAGIYDPATDDRTLQHHAGPSARFIANTRDVLRALSKRRANRFNRWTASFERAVQIMWFPETARMNQEILWAADICDVMADEYGNLEAKEVAK